MESKLKRKNSELGYIQGLNFIVIQLLRNLNEEEAFLILAFIYDHVYEPFFFKDMKGLKEFLNLICRILEDKYNEIYNNLKINQDLLKNILLSWIVCLFMNLDLDFEQKWILLKFIVIFKKSGLLKIVLYIFKKIYKKLRRSENFIQFHNELKNVSIFLKKNKIAKRLCKININKQTQKVIDDFKKMKSEEDKKMFIIYKNVENIINRDNFQKHYFFNNTKLTPSQREKMLEEFVELNEI